MSSTTIAISGDVFTAMQTECMNNLRKEFDQVHRVYQEGIINRAKKLQLPAEFIQELRNDQI